MAIQIIPEKRMGTRDRFVNAFSQVGQDAAQALPQIFGERQKKQQEEQQYQQENQQYKQMMGKDLSRNPAIRKIEIESSLKQGEQGKQFQQQQDLLRMKHEHETKIKSQELEGKQKEKTEKAEKELQENAIPLQGALNAIEQMKQLRTKGNLGRGSNVLGFFGGETAKDRGKYETLGNSLISFASNIPIRNRQEFEKLAGHISDPNITDDEAEGVLDALQQIISNSLRQYEPQRGKPSGEKRKSLQEIFG